MYICVKISLNAFCTISTSSHLYKTYALADSIAVYGGSLYVLLIDAEKTIINNQPKNVVFYNLNQLEIGIGKNIISKYNKNKDKLRWALKPVFLNHLLAETPKIIYVDNDIYFFGEYSFLFDELESNSVLLTPHFYRADPAMEPNWLEANFRIGLYNAGFIGVNSKAKLALDWWSNCCYYNVKKSYWRGLFDDQKYLDLFPILFDDVKIIKNRGCNLAGWNYKNYHVQRNANNEVIIENNYSLIFIHFGELSLLEFSDSKSVFYNEYTKYLEALRKHNHSFDLKRNVFKKETILPYFYYLRWRFNRIFEY